MRNWNAITARCFNGNSLTVVPYLWGIETCICFLICHGNLHAALGFVVPYLWGIETVLTDLFVFCAMVIVVPYLWGIETVCCFLNGTDTIPECCTLPMRNWNIATAGFPFCDALYQAVVSYLWGIETRFLTIMLHIACMLYLTYEELKHSFYFL